MEMEFTRLEKVVGTFIIGVMLLLMTTLVVIGRGKDWFETYRAYYTTFNETYNLQENAAVKLFKADIGKVKGITLEKNRVRVKLLILDRYASRIRQDALAVVERPTLIGSEYISIIPGSQEAPLIPENGDIPSREKRSITDIMAEFEVEKTAKMVVRTMQGLSEITQRLSDKEGPLWASLDNISHISANMKQITDDLKAGKGPMGVILKSEDLLQKIIYNIETLGGILQSIQTASAQAPHTMDLVQDNLLTFRTRVDEAEQVLNNIRKAASDLRIITENIRTGSNKCPEFRRISATA